MDQVGPGDLPAIVLAVVAVVGCVVGLLHALNRLQARKSEGASGFVVGFPRSDLDRLAADIKALAAALEKCDRKAFEQGVETHTLLRGVVERLDALVTRLEE